MANTVTVYREEVEGANSAVYADLAFTGTYATGGETLTPAVFGLSRIHAVDADVTSATATAITATYNRTTGKLLLKAPAGTEVANGTAHTAVTVSVRVLGA